MSRKYKQGGYMEAAARSESSARRPAGPRDEGEGPRGRGLGAPTATVFRCGRCGHLQTEPGQPGAALEVDAVCGECGTDLHSCKHCVHFDTSASLQCRQKILQSIAKKDLRNDCQLFATKRSQEFAAEAEPPSDARAAFDDLFNL